MNRIIFLMSLYLCWAQNDSLSGEPIFDGTWVISGVSGFPHAGGCKESGKGSCPDVDIQAKSLLGNKFRVINGDQIKVEWLGRNQSINPVFASFQADHSLAFSFKEHSLLEGSIKVRKAEPTKLSGTITFSNISYPISFEAVLDEQGIWLCGNHSSQHAANGREEITKYSNTYGCRNWHRK